MGRADPDAMLAEMRPTQLGEWLAFYELDPWGEQRADLRAGIVATAVHQAAGSKNEGGAAITPQQFMPFVERKKVPLSAKAKSVLKSLSPKPKKKQG